MKKKIRLSHNDFFQRQFQRIEFAISFIKENLPEEIVKRIDFKTLRMAPGNFVGKALRNRRSDVLYEARMGGRKSLFYIHLEHQRSPNKKMAFRMLVYTVHIWEQFEAQYPKKDLPLIFPMVVYQGKRKWSAPKNVHDLLDVPEYLKLYCPQMSFELMDLSSLKDEDIRGEILQRMVLHIMMNIDSPDINELLFEKYLPFWDEISKEKRGIEYIEDMLYYLSYKSQYLDRERTVEQLSHYPETQNVREVVMTLAEQWKQEGIDQGQIRLVSKQLHIKFRNDAQDWVDSLNRLSSKELEIIAERILTAGTLEEVFSELGE